MRNQIVEIGEFEEKVNDVYEKIQAMLRGDIIEFDKTDPSTGDVSNNVGSLNKNKEHERMLWWKYATNIKQPAIVSEPTNTTHDVSTEKQQIARSTYDNYSKWDKWSPDDPVSREEEARAQQQLLDDFERNNPEFCQEFTHDQKTREKGANRSDTKEAINKADKLRNVGNKYYTNNDDSNALFYFQEALRLTPLDIRLTNNIAQVYIRSKVAYDDALEFLDRSLFLDPHNIKATSRKAHVLTELKRFDDAEALLSGLLSALPITQKPSPSVTPTATCFATAPSGNLLAFSDLTVSMTTAQQAEVERQRADCRLQAEEARMEATHRNYMAWKAGAIGGDEVDGTIATEYKEWAALVASLDRLFSLLSVLSGANSALDTNQLLRGVISSITTSNSDPCGEEGQSGTQLVRVICGILTERAKHQLENIPSTVLLVGDIKDKLLANPLLRTYLRCENTFETLILPHIILLLHLYDNEKVLSSIPDKRKYKTQILFELYCWFELLLACCGHSNERSLQHMLFVCNKEYHLFDQLIPQLILTCSREITLKGQNYDLSKSSTFQHQDNIFSRMPCVIYTMASIVPIITSLQSTNICAFQPLRDTLANNTLLAPRILDLSVAAMVNCNKLELATSTTTSAIGNNIINSHNRSGTFVSMLSYIEAVTSFVIDKYLSFHQSNMKSTNKNTLSTSEAVLKSTFMQIISLLHAYIHAIKTPAHLVQLSAPISPYFGPNFHLIFPSTPVPTDSDVTRDIAVMERFLAVLLYFSQYPHQFLPLFTTPVAIQCLPSSATSASDACGVLSLSESIMRTKADLTIDGVELLLHMLDACPHHRINTLAVLMNLLAPTPSPEKHSDNHTSNVSTAKIIDRIAVSSLETVVDHVLNYVAASARSSSLSPLTPPPSDPESVLGQDVYTRYLGLLARISGHERTQRHIGQPQQYTFLIKRLTKITGYLNDTPLSKKGSAKMFGSDMKWLDLERGYLVTLLASLKPLNKDCMSAGVTFGLVESLFAIFPVPRSELGEVTRESVTLVPSVIAPPTLLGNAACCLLPYADIPEYAATIFNTTTNKDALHIEKLICAMATCTDLRVRKNLSILISKGCRKEEVKNRVSALRGIEIIRELNS